MVKEIDKDDIDRVKKYQCEECKLVYEDKKWAEKCEKWCKKNKSCNIEITKHAVKEKRSLK